MVSPSCPRTFMFCQPKAHEPCKAPVEQSPKHTGLWLTTRGAVSAPGGVVCDKVTLLHCKEFGYCPLQEGRSARVWAAVCAAKIDGMGPQRPGDSRKDRTECVLPRGGGVGAGFWCVYIPSGERESCLRCRTAW